VNVDFDGIGIGNAALERFLNFTGILLPEKQGSKISIFSIFSIFVISNMDIFQISIFIENIDISQQPISNTRY
jgi:hypothetical protein